MRKGCASLMSAKAVRGIAPRRMLNLFAVIRFHNRAFFPEPLWRLQSLLMRSRSGRERRSPLSAYMSAGVRNDL